MNQTDKNIAMAKECGFAVAVSGGVFTIQGRGEQLDEYTSRVCADCKNKQGENEMNQCKTQADCFRELARVAAECADALSPTTKEPEIPEGYTRHDGVECPVHPDTVVNCLFHDGQHRTNKKAEIWNWARANNVLAYKVIKPATVMVELSVEDAEIIGVDAEHSHRSYQASRRTEEACRKALSAIEQADLQCEVSEKDKRIAELENIAGGMSNQIGALAAKCDIVERDNAELRAKLDAMEISVLNEQNLSAERLARMPLAETKLEVTRDCLLYERNRLNLANELLEAANEKLDALGKQEPVKPIEREEGMDRTYIPLAGGWEIQTKGTGSSFRISHVTGEGERDYQRWLVIDNDLHEPLEQMARAIHAELYAKPIPADPAIPEGWQQLMKFYGARTPEKMVDEMQSHIERLQAKVLRLDPPKPDYPNPRVA